MYEWLLHIVTGSPRSLAVATLPLWNQIGPLPLLSHNRNRKRDSAPVMAEFLPLCDVLFNVISLAAYFCDIVFDMVYCYALMERGRTKYVGVVLLLVGASLLISQVGGNGFMSMILWIKQTPFLECRFEVLVGILTNIIYCVESLLNYNTSFQMVSLRWYLHKTRSLAAMAALDAAAMATENLDKKSLTVQPAPLPLAPPKPLSKLWQYFVIVLHFFQLGVLWRYAKLFVPVDLRHVKHEVRDLCLLRLVHAFCQAAPMLLLQLHVMVTMNPDDYLIVNPEIQLKSLGGHITKAIVQPPTATQQQQLSVFRELSLVSAILSLFSVCWALASFSKNVRLQNVHRLVLTWLGVIFQLLWRLGTVVSRVTALTVYASLYGYWIFLVIVLHWFSMFLWLISPKNVFHGERITKTRKGTLAALIACVYIFAYVNLQEVNRIQFSCFLFVF